MSNLETINHKSINTSLPSLLSLEERHQLLSPIIQETAEDINNDPESNLFSELDGDGLDDI